jgi:hypothetical protein
LRSTDSLPSPRALRALPVAAIEVAALEAATATTTMGVKSPELTVLYPPIPMRPSTYQTKKEEEEEVDSGTLTTWKTKTKTIPRACPAIS